MTRTTVDIDGPILTEVKRVQKREGKSLGATISGLLADALARRKATQPSRAKLAWTSRDLGARVDLDDKGALWSILDADDTANR